MMQQDEPLLVLNVILGVFTVVSFAQVCASCWSNSGSSSKKTPDLREIHLTLEQINSQITDIRLYLEQTDTKEQHATASIVQPYSQIEEPTLPVLSVLPVLPVQAAQDKEQSQDKEQEQPAPKKAKQQKVIVINELKPVTPKQDDKHSQLIAHLKIDEEVTMTYKKQTFTAKFIARSTAQHGYVLKSGNAEYNTPSDFSRAKKFSINDKIKSDNGWDTVTVQRNGTKLTLNELISEPCPT